MTSAGNQPKDEKLLSRIDERETALEARMEDMQLEITQLRARLSLQGRMDANPSTLLVRTAKPPILGTAVVPPPLERSVASSPTTRRKDFTKLKGVPALTPPEPQIPLVGPPQELRSAHPAQLMPKKNEPPLKGLPRVAPLPTVPAAAGLLPNVAVLVICYNRPDYLRKTLESLLLHFPRADEAMVSVFISQDGTHSGVASVAQQFMSTANERNFKAKHLHHPQKTLRGDSGYHKLARHFKWAFGQVFELAADIEGVIILEDDMEIAVDFFDMFLGLLPVLKADPTLWTISAWNDNGKPQFAHDETRIVRSDFFPGLGWYMSRELWAELGPKWPNAYWDDWMREPKQRQGRACLRPEVSRTHNFGAVGVSRGQYFNSNIAPVKLNDRAVPFRSQADALIAELSKDAYDKALDATLSGAVDVSHADVRHGRAPGDVDIRMTYKTVTGSGPTAFKTIARELGIMGDEKAGVPRTAYKGIVSIRYLTERQLFLYPAPGFVPYD